MLEDFRLPIGFDVSSAPVFNVNTFYFDATALFEMQPAWTYFAVRKKVEGAEVIQFERLINEVVDWHSDAPLSSRRAERQGLPLSAGKGWRGPCGTSSRH